MEEISPKEERFQDNEDYKNKLEARAALAQLWGERITAADKAYQKWADRFHIEAMCQYYEGYQWLTDTDENNRPYTINMVFSTIETKLPSILFDNPQFSVRARPIGLLFDEENAEKDAQAREDALNFVCARKDFGLTDKHELAALDSFFGFGILEVNYSEDPYINPYIPIKGKIDPLDSIYCKQVPFDTFRVSSTANWDLSNGKWYGYYEFIPRTRLRDFKGKLNLTERELNPNEEASFIDTQSGKLVAGADSAAVITPPDHLKVWKLWDFEKGKFYIYCPDGATEEGNSILLEEKFDYSPLSFLRFGKRRKGWYPYPRVWNWLSPQDELNDIRQAQRIHRKRFSRKYGVLESMIEEEELDKFINGPDGTVVKWKRDDAIKPIQDAAMNPVDIQSLINTYDDFNRISGTPDEARAIQTGNRTTATQASIVNQRAQIRDSKDSICVATFMCDVGKNILRALKQVKDGFWIQAKLPKEGILDELQTKNTQWRRVIPESLRDSETDVDLTVTSVSPISQGVDKKAFLEFLAVITQYEILAFSPELLREAAYRLGYKNEAVLNQFQQMAQLAAIGRLAQAKAQAGLAPQGPQPSAPGMLPQQQVDASTPPDIQEITNMLMNGGAVQQ